MAAVAPAPSTNGNHVNGLINGKGPKSKNAKRRSKKKEQKAAKQQGEGDEADTERGEPASADASTAVKANPEPVYVAPTDPDDDTYKAFADVFARFQPVEDEHADQRSGAGPVKGEVIYSDDEMMSDSDNSDAEVRAEVSKRKQRKLQRLTVAELKQLVKRSEVVEWCDVTASDPRLLVAIKSYRNTIPVPPHWSQKRDYLQGKRGIEKAQFQLPSNIADTGIAAMKDALKEKEADQTLKAKTRERVQPKMGKVDIDYQKLHDAFFRFQTKPPLSAFGETYYEGKEYETKFKERKPGDLSNELKEALSIPPLAPPPWLISMQRFGPPPSYPHLKIPGLNAPIPEGAQWGFHPGGWGKPPVDEFGRPLYGDVFGMVPDGQGADSGEPVQKELWGELEPEEEESEEEEEEEEEEDEEEGAAPADTEGTPDGLQTPSGLDTPSGVQSMVSTVPGGLETPDFLELRKGARGRRDTTVDTEDGAEENRQLFQVIPETDASIRGFMGSERGYDMQALLARSAGVSGQAPQVLGAEDRGTKRKAQTSGVDVALDPSELENLTESELQERYESARRAAPTGLNVPGGNSNSAEREDLAMIRQELAQKRQRTEQRRREGREANKEKFKF